MNDATDSAAISLSRYLEILLTHWKRLGMTCAVCAILFYAGSFLEMPVFTSTAVVTVSNTISQDLGSQLGMGIGSVGSVLRSGLLGGAGGDQSKEYQAILNSDGFVRRLLLEKNWVPLIFPNLWDSRAHRWSVGGGFSPWGIIDAIRSLWAPTVVLAPTMGADPLAVKAAALEAAGGPPLYKAVEKFKAMTSVDLDERTGFITITATLNSPANAQMIAQGMVDQLNQTERERARHDAEAEVLYLRQHVADETNDTVRTAYMGVLERQLKIQTLSAAVNDYAVREVVVPLVPEIKSAPLRILYFLFGAIVGLLIAMVYEAIMLALKNRYADER